MTIDKESAKLEGWALTGGVLRIAYDERGGSRFRSMGELFSFFIEKSKTSKEHFDIYLTQPLNWVDGQYAVKSGWFVNSMDYYADRIKELVDRGDVVATKALLHTTRHRLRQ